MHRAVSVLLLVVMAGCNGAGKAKDGHLVNPAQPFGDLAISVDFTYSTAS